VIAMMVASIHAATVYAPALGNSPVVPVVKWVNTN
jgi:hypothetical protein